MGITGKIFTACILHPVRHPDAAIRQRRRADEGMHVMERRKFLHGHWPWPRWRPSWPQVEQRVRHSPRQHVWEAELAHALILPETELMSNGMVTSPHYLASQAGLTSCGAVRPSTWRWPRPPPWPWSIRRCARWAATISGSSMTPARAISALTPAAAPGKRPASTLSRPGADKASWRAAIWPPIPCRAVSAGFEAWKHVWSALPGLAASLLTRRANWRSGASRSARRWPGGAATRTPRSGVPPQRYPLRGHLSQVDGKPYGLARDHAPARAGGHAGPVGGQGRGRVLQG